MALSIGDFVRVRGYTVVARAEHLADDGSVVVVHNNSTHYLVLKRHPAYPVGMAQVCGSYPYADSNLSLLTAYRVALARMVRVATGEDV